ncbi:MAG: hypothetical protein KGH63_01055 [Candidatus Micrarchaeota archaeon]|nr:hypothetical protein [Candidatus Micrarchaeota archaeon]
MNKPTFCVAFSPRLLMLLLLALPIAFSDLSAPLVSSAQFYLYEQQSVSVTTGRLTELRINYSIPVNSTVVSAPPSAVRATDSEGNPYLQIYQPSPVLPYTYAINTTVSTQEQFVDSLPAQWPPLPSAGNFLQSTDQVPSGEPAFQSLASQISANATTPFEQLSDLAQWTHDYITYDPSMVGQELPAKQILQVRRGVCTEYTTLFVTLARALGYPTRFVNGYAYSDQYHAWLGHAWAEVYIGRWVSVDPTWLEVGRLDATHIVSSRQAVQDFKAASVTAFVSPSSAQMIWSGGATRGAAADNVHLLSEQTRAPETNYRLLSSSARLPPGGKFVVVMAYPASDYRLLPTTLTPCSTQSGPPIVALSGGLSTPQPFYALGLYWTPNSTFDTEERLTTAAGQTSYAIWAGQAGTDLQRNVRYTCPLTLNSEYLDLRALPLNITTADPVDWPAMGAVLSHSSIAPGGLQEVYVRLPSSMAGHPVTIAEEHLLLSTTADARGQATLAFNATSLGLHTLYAFSDAGDPVALTYTVGASGDLSVSDVHSARKLIEGQANQLLLTWAAPPSASGWQLAWSWGGQNGQVPLSAPGAVAIPFTPASAGDSLLTLRLLDSQGQEQLRTTQPLTVLSAARVMVDNLTLTPASSPNRWLATVHVSADPPLPDLQLRLDGRVFGVPGDGYVSVDLAPGLYNGTLSWTDAAGAAQEKIFQVDARAPLSSYSAPAPAGVPAIPVSFPSLSSLPGVPALYGNLCLLPLALLLIFGLAALVWFFRPPPSQSVLPKLGRKPDETKPPSP